MRDRILQISLNTAVEDRIINQSMKEHYQLQRKPQLKPNRRKIPTSIQDIAELKLRRINWMLKEKEVDQT
jgi:hypothetical protein